MKTGDLLWALSLGAVALLLVVPVTHDFIMISTKNHPYIMGFIKFAILATMGELLAIRIVSKDWKLPPGMEYRAAIWGLIGAGIVIVFGVFTTGVESIIKQGLVPVPSGALAGVVTAFWISAINNIAFAPTLFLMHRITDTYLDLADGKLGKIGSIRFAQVAQTIDWNGLVSFVMVRTIPFFWIPAHTITFSLPPEYRVLFAASLSLALGCILGFAKSRK